MLHEKHKGEMNSVQNDAEQLMPSNAQDTPMNIESVESEIDPQTGFGVDHVFLSDAEFEKISVKRISEDEIKIIATEEDGYEWSYPVEIEQKAAQVLKYHKPRRELEDDIQDALLSAGYCVMGSDLE